MAIGRKSVLLILLLGIAAYPHAGRAESVSGNAQAGVPQVQGSAGAGFDGFFRIGKCMFVRIRIENTGPDLTCEVGIPVAQDLFRQTVSLPSPSRKTLVMYIVPPGDLHELEIVLSAGGKTISTIRTAVQRLADEERLHLISSTLQPAYPAHEVSEGAKTMERRVFLAPADLPENWNAYSIVDRITLDASDTARLNEAQRTALSRWVLLGGNVSLPRWDGAGARQWSLSPEDQQATTRNVPQASDSETAHGLGMFRFIRGPDRSPFPADPSQNRVDTIPLSELDQELFRICALRNPVARGYLAWYLAAFLLLYGLAIVVWLARSSPAGTERPWKWRVVPAIAILFSILSLGLGAVANTGEMSMQQFSLTHVFPGAADTFASSRVTALSPQAAAYQLAPSATSAYLVQEESGDDSIPHIYVFDAKGSPTAQVDLDLWATQTFSVASFSSQGQFWILRRGDLWTVVNRSESPLHGCTLIEPAGTSRLGDVPAHTELDISRGTKTPGSERSFEVSPDSVLISQAVSHYQAEASSGSVGSCVICSLEGVTPSLSSVSAKTAYHGSAAVVFHLGPTPVYRGRKDGK